MRILLLTHAFNALAQRLYVELARRRHQVAVELDVNDAVTEQAVALARPDVIVAPFLKRAIPASVWSRIPCLVVHPGPPGDRGPSALDWAIQEGVAQWGVTVLQAEAEMDAGPVWAHAAFPMREATKSSLYRREVRDAATACVLAALDRMAAPGARPASAAELTSIAQGRSRAPMRQADRAIDWARHDTAEVLRRIRAADGSPGVLDDVAGTMAYLHGAHRAAAAVDAAPGTLVGRHRGAVLRATRDGAVWITHLRRKPVAEPELKLPAVDVLGAAATQLPEVAGDGVEKFGGVRYEEHGAVGVLRFDFHNGAMGVAQCEALRRAYARARARPTRVIVLAGGEEYWSNGIDLAAIEASPTPSDASWHNINAIDDLARDILTTRTHLTVAALAGDAGAGGAFLALAADRVWLRAGVVLNPHYRGMGNLYGSEYWTYVLPRRAGASAAAIAERRLPMGCDEALEAKLADGVLEGSPAEFFVAAAEQAAALASCPSFPSLLEAKNAARDRDEAAKPLERYRAEELERMRLNFYGFDPSYHVARYHFVYKLPKARTPSWLAPHRAPQGSAGSAMPMASRTE